jgi:hypothetical protein
MAARFAVRQRARLGGELLHECVRDLLVHDQPLGRHADLAHVGEAAERRSLHGLVEIGVVEDHHRGLAAEFEQHRLEIARRRSRR